MPKLADVARAAGVSVASASRVLSGGRTVSVEVRLRVEAAATRLNYRPNPSAQALASRLKRIAIVAADLADPFIGSIVEEVVGSLRARGHVATILAAAADDEGSVQGWIPHGIVFIGEFRTPMQWRPLAGLPRLNIVDRGDGELGLRLELGVVRGFELACRYLSEARHRQIGLLGTSRAVDAASLGMLAPDAGPSLLDIPADTPNRVAVSLREALDRPEPPTALVCTSDAMALAALRYCAIAGIRVPAELSVIGFGDSPVARHSYPALSSVRVAVRAIGAYSANAMSELLFGRVPQPFVPPVRLVIRESSAPRNVSREA